MKKIFLFRFIAIILMCLSSLLIKSENVVCKASCTAFSRCEMQQQKIASDIHKKNIFYNDDGFFIKI